LGKSRSVTFCGAKFFPGGKELGMDEDAPGLGYAVGRLWRTALPDIKVTGPAPGIRFERDIPIRLRDRITLRANVFRPDDAGRFPVLMSAHPYGKDVLPQRTPFGYLPLARYRFIRDSGPITYSAYTAWEAPDPSYWVPHGYVVINLDLRGFGKSEGVGTLLSDEEARDYADAIDWAAAQSWSSGKVGLNGVSYLAISQWRVAALRPPALGAICPWEGFSDVYRDVAYFGGVRDDGFLPFWAPLTEKAGRTQSSLRNEQLAHPNWDGFWESRVPELERIEVPALICASFSDQNLHTRGGFEAYRRISSKHRYLFTHRGGKWSTYYSPESLALQKRFFDCFLKGEQNGMKNADPVRLEVREQGDLIHSVRVERAWPPANVEWTRLWLAPNQMRDQPVEIPATTRFEAPAGGVSFSLRVADDMEISGPMKLKLHVELGNGADAHLFVAVRKFRGREHVSFEGSFGFGRDVVAKGCLGVAHRGIDQSRSEPFRPFHPCDRSEPLAPGQIVPIEIEILPSSTLFRRGEILRLDVQGHWFWKRNPFFGMFPGYFQASPPATVILHMGGSADSFLLVPRMG
jgi:predicted acyl esterase